MSKSTVGARFIARERGIIGSPVRKSAIERANELFSSVSTEEVSVVAEKAAVFAEPVICGAGRNYGVALVRLESSAGRLRRNGKLLPMGVDLQ